MERTDIIPPTEAELQMSFVASCIESAAKAAHTDYLSMLRRMNKVQLIERYIYPCYDTLHTESRQAATQDVLQCLVRWEAQQEGGAQ